MIRRILNSVRLTRVQLEWIRLRVGHELGYEEIAKRMGISVRTVKHHGVELHKKISGDEMHSCRRVHDIRLTKFAIFLGIVQIQPAKFRGKQ